MAEGSSLAASELRLGRLCTVGRHEREQRQTALERRHVLNHDGLENNDIPYSPVYSYVLLQEGTWEYRGTRENTGEYIGIHGNVRVEFSLTPQLAHQ